MGPKVVSTTDAYGGATPAGAAGPHRRQRHRALPPAADSADNAGIVDTTKALKDVDGGVDYTTDVV